MIQKLIKLQERIEAFVKRKERMLKVYSKTALMVIISLILITDTIQTLLDVVYLVIGLSVLTYITLFGKNFLR